jgi:predicted glutamine amidotransferase
MCRLFGFRSNVASRVHRSLIEAENALVQQATAHSDGWGIGYYQGQEAYIVKAEGGAADDERFSRISRRLESQTMLVHVRRATVGDQDYLNCHPFRHGCWVFAHNGTIFDFDRIRPFMENETLPDLSTQAFGSTDSERFFYYLISSLVRAGFTDHGREKIDTQKAAQVLREAVGRIYGWAREVAAPPPILNFILTNGAALFAQRAGLELYLASQKLVCADFLTCKEPEKVCMEKMGLFYGDGETDMKGPLRQVNHLLIASEPIGGEDVWEEIPEGVLVSVDESMRLYMSSSPVGFQKCPSPPAPQPRIQKESASLRLWRGTL